MDWTSRLPVMGDFDTRPMLAPPGTVALRDLELKRWRPAAAAGGYEVSTEGDMSLSERPGNSSENATSSDALAICSSAIAGYSSPSSMEEEEDQDDVPDVDSPLEYARFHGLCRDYEMDHPLRSRLVPSPTRDARRDLEEPSDLTFWMCSEVVGQQVQDSLANERWDVDKETAALLLEVLALEKQSAGDELARLKDVDMRPLRLELPVLAGDHDFEMMGLRRRNEVRLSGAGVVPFPLDVEKDEGLAFSKAAVDDKHRLDHSLAREKLDISKETLEFLRELSAVSVEGDMDYAAEAYKTYKKMRSLRASPVLLPVTPPCSPGNPPSEAMQIDMTSTPEDLIGKDAAAVEEELLREDGLISATPTDGQDTGADDPSAAIDEFVAIPSSSSPISRKRLRSIRVEPPLTPQDARVTSEEGSTAEGKNKRLRLDQDTMAFLPDPDITSFVEPSGLLQKRDDTFLQDSIMREAESVTRELHNEQLVELDTTMRVKVPQLDPVQLQAPWDRFTKTSQNETDPQENFLRTMREESLKDQRKWTGVSKIERSLPWAPFPSYLAKVDLNEEFDDESLERYLSQLNLEDGSADVDVWVLLATENLLRTLRKDDSEDEEIQPILRNEDEPDHAIATEPEVSISVRTDAAAKPEMLDLLCQKRLSIGQMNDTGRAVEAKDIPDNHQTTLGTSSDLMQTDSLAHFMHLRGKAPKPQNGTADQARKDGPSKETASTELTVQNVAPAAVMIPHALNPAALETPSIQTPMPELGCNTHAEIPIIVSSTFITNRQLTRQLERLLPSITFIERDTTVVARQQHGQVIHGEADITISPSTAVISTFLQKLKQKPLPRQTTFHGIRDHIVSIAPRYERLMILVSEGNIAIPTDEATTATTARPLDPLDCLALTDLAAWTTSSLPTDVRISYIPGGAAEAAHWLAAAISHYGIADGSVQLLHDETMWERWLRCAGFNAFAAQAVLGRLKGEVVEPSSSFGREHCGLAAFLKMSLQERVERFADVLGGERVLKRVSTIVDGGWVVKGDGGGIR